VKHSNYINNLPEDDLLMSKRVAEETAIMYDSVVHHHSTFTTRSYYSEIAHAN
jgi:hypothetical protein